jgi:hypothetical protein
MNYEACKKSDWFPAAILLGFVALGAALFFLFMRTAGVGVIQQRHNHPPMPYGKRINGCRYILTPDWRGQIVHTEHAANCDNHEHAKRKPRSW